MDKLIRKPQILKLGVDELTLVLTCSKKIYYAEWIDHLDQILYEFLRLSKIENLFGKLVDMRTKLPAGYTNGLTVENVPWYLAVAWHEDRFDMGVCIRFAAWAWGEYKAEYEKQFGTTMNIRVFLKMIQSPSYNARLSRIDLTADYFNYPCPLSPSSDLSPDTLYRELKAGHFAVTNCNGKRSSKTDSAITRNGFYSTFYLGSPKAECRLRVYDKKAEQISARGVRLQEAQQAESWVRFELVLRGKYAHDISKQILEDIHTDDELSQLIARHISDKYRWFDIKKDEALEITEDLIGAAKGIKIAPLSNSKPQDNSLRSSLMYLIHGSGLFPFLLKIRLIFGEDAEDEAWERLKQWYDFWLEHYADQKRDIRPWLEKHGAALRNQTLEDVFSLIGGI